MYIAKKRMTKFFILAVLLGFLIPYQIFLVYNGHVITSKPKDVIPVIVIDEHHEVIPYWINAVKENRIRKTNNMLVHFDAHSDLGTPRFASAMPPFRWPDEITVSTMEALMESNDVFIISAVILGLFDHIVWIYPKWANDKVADYQRCQISIGLTNFTMKQNASSYCLCLESKTAQGKCFVLVRELSNPEMLIPKQSCKVETTFQFDSVREDHALKFLAEETLENKNTLLDFDEDYFGVQSLPVELSKAGLNFSKVETLDLVVEDLFCPENSIDENVASSILTDLIGEMISCKKDITCNIMSFYIVSSSELPDFLKTEKNTFLCRSIDMVSTFNKIVYILLTFTSDELQLIQETKFCLSSSPKFSTGNYFRVCHGVLIPNDILVKLKNTTSEEILEGKNQIMMILKTLSKQVLPKFITIARSLRDGYTPRNFYREIENSIFWALREAFRLKSNFQIHYDRDRLRL